MKQNITFVICIIENLKPRHEKLWFVLRDIFPENKAVIIPKYDNPCRTWEDARKMISSLEKKSEILIIADLALDDNDIKDARFGVDECRRLLTLQPKAKIIAATGFENVLHEIIDGDSPFSAVLSKGDPIWEKTDRDLAEYLRNEIEFVRTGKREQTCNNTMNMNYVTNKSKNSKKVFISHSHEDGDLAKAIVDLLCSSLRMRKSDFICTSVDGASLAGGVRFNDHLRECIRSIPAFVSLLTPDSMRSIYVQFEMGARWGLVGNNIPLCARGFECKKLEGPLKELVALNLELDTQVMAFVKDLGELLEIRLNETVEYMDGIKLVTRLAKKRPRKGKATI